MLTYAGISKQLCLGVSLKRLRPVWLGGVRFGLEGSEPGAWALKYVGLVLLAWRPQLLHGLRSANVVLSLDRSTFMIYDLTVKS